MTNTYEYSFDERLRLSDGTCESRSVVEILMQNIPGALNITRAHEVNDKSGTDWWVEHESGRHLSVDAKVRERDFGLDDLALETWSVVERRKVGWTRDPAKRCDFILWLWMDNGRWCMVPFPMLCKVFAVKWQDWSAAYKTARQHTPESGGYHSECVFVPRKEVWSEIYRQFNRTKPQ